MTDAEHQGHGPLHGVAVLELAGIGPVPFAAMMLADMGADVVRVDRVDRVGIETEGSTRADILRRSRRSIAVDLKHPDGVGTVLALVRRADVLLEGFRPGVTERLGLGPSVCCEANPGLVYGRMTGWGREGPYASSAGHDLNYIALAGALAPMGHSDRPPAPPLNLVGDFGGGGMMLALGVCAALVERQSSGAGQVVDAAMLDGAALLMASIFGFRASGEWVDDREANLVDGGAPFYTVYETSDHRYVAVGAIEPQFYRELVSRLGLDDAELLGGQHDRDRWPARKEQLAALFRTRTRDEWCRVLEHSDACFAPVLSLDEAAVHPHNVERATFVEIDGVVHPAPAPRFARTPSAVRRPPVRPGEHTSEVLVEWGLSSSQVEQLTADGVVA